MCLLPLNMEVPFLMPNRNLGGQNAHTSSPSSSPSWHCAGELLAAWYRRRRAGMRCAGWGYTSPSKSVAWSWSWVGRWGKWIWNSSRRKYTFAGRGSGEGSQKQNVYFKLLHREPTKRQHPAIVSKKIHKIKDKIFTKEALKWEIHWVIVRSQL